MNREMDMIDAGKTGVLPPVNQQECGAAEAGNGLPDRGYRGDGQDNVPKVSI
jgi:hypothetical protein